MSTQPLEFVEEKPEQEKPEPISQEWGVVHSPTIGKLVEALAKAQLKFKAVVKQTDNAAFMRGGRASKYADLAEYIDATQQPLAENGLVVMQWPDVSPEAKSMSLVTFLAHSSGEWMKGRLTLPATGRDGFTPQTCGSSITYARRYSYAAITGVASEDDDGNSASGRGSVAAAQEVAKSKIAQFEREQGIRAETVPDTIFYTRPPSQNGNAVEFINIHQFIASHTEHEEALKMAFTAHGSKKTKSNTALVPTEKLKDLLEKLAGDLGLNVHELKAAG